MAASTRNRLMVVAAVAALVMAMLWLRGRHMVQIEPRAPSSTERAADAASQGTAPHAAAETAWRLQVELRDEKNIPISGRVYVTNATGDLLGVFDTEPPSPLVQSVRGRVHLVAFAWDYVPQYFERIESTVPGGVRTVVVHLDRGLGIGGRITDDAGEPVTSERAWGMVVRALPLDPPPWLERWKSHTDHTGRWFAFETFPEDDGSFHIGGLPPGRYEVTCEQPQMRDLPRDDRRQGALLGPEPVGAAVGDADIRVVCRRAAEIEVHFIDAETGVPIPLGLVVEWQVTGHRPGYTCSGHSNGGQGPILPVRPGSNLTLTSKAEGYREREPLVVAVSRDPGPQDVMVPFWRDPEGYGVVELTVVDETNEPVHPLIIGRALAGGHREEQLDGHYAVAVPAGDQVLRLESPKDHRLGLLPGDDENGDVAARAYLPVDVRVHVPRAGRIVRAVQMRRAALIWVRQGAKSTRPGARTLAEATAGGARLFRAGTEIEGAFHRLDEDSGLVALVEPGEYVVQGPVGTGIMNAEVVAKAAEVTEVWLRGGSEK